MTEFDKEILTAGIKALIILFSAVGWCCWMTFKKEPSKKIALKASLTYL
jgi:hypothetical protein